MKLIDYVVREKISQTDLAGKIGCSESYLSQLLNGTKSPSIPMMIKIMKATNDRVKPNDFARNE